LQNPEIFLANGISQPFIIVVHNFLHMTTYVLKLAKRGETAICFGQVKVALGPGARGAVAAPVDKPGRPAPARRARAPPVSRTPCNGFKKWVCFSFP